MKPQSAKHLLAALLLIATANTAVTASTESDFLPADTAIAVQMLKDQKADNCYMGKRIRETAEAFLNAPYKGGTLEGEPERLRINLREFDCTTFVEIILALSETAARGDTAFVRFAGNLAAIRYQNGESDKYAKRLHYFSLWIKQNAAQGRITEIIPQNGIARCETKEINFMSSHADLYPALKEKSRIAEIQKAEKELSTDTVCYIPKEKVPQLTSEEIRDGDIIAIVTDKKGLDITHVGIAAIQDGEPHLLHASSAAKRVILDPRTLYEYLMHYPSHRGIRILRATE